MASARRLPAAVLSSSLLVSPTIAEAVVPATTSLDLGGGVSLELVYVNKGSFTQGSPATEANRKDDERTRKVTLTRDFYLGKFPVTLAQYTRFTSATGYRTEAEKGSSGGSGFDGQGLVQRKEFTWKNPGFPQNGTHPVTLVTWDDARAFNDWLSRISGRDVALPSEAQWEYAYRAGTTSAYYTGTSTAAALTLGWFKENSPTGTRPVGQQKPNGFGLYDMGGNAFEWCADWYAPYSDGALVDPLQTVADTSDKARRVLRGGSWFKEARHGRAAARNRSTPGSRNADNGFRVMAGLEVRAPSSAPPLGPASVPETPSPASGNGPAAAGAGVGVFLGGSCCAGVGLFGLIFWLVTRRGTGGITFRPGHDGFWIIAPPRLRGSTLNYRYTAGGAVLMGNVVIEPGPNGQYVYTGPTPSNIQSVNIVSNRRAPHAAPYRSRSEQGRSYERRSDPPFQGYPPAY